MEQILLISEELKKQLTNMEINLRKFNMDEITHDKVVVLIGKRDTGKSYLCKDILYHHLLLI